MLKPVDPGPQPPERPVGELVHQLIEEGKAYARAEFDLLKAIGTAKAKALALPGDPVRGGASSARSPRSPRSRSASSSRSRG